MNTSTINKFLCFLQNEEGKPCVLPVVLEVEQEMVNKASNIKWKIIYCCKGNNVVVSGQL